MLGRLSVICGIVLINNGMCTLYRVDGKSAAVMNILTGGTVRFYQCGQSGNGKLLRGRHRTSVWLYLSFCGLYEAGKIKSHPLCLVLYLVAVNAVIFGTIEGITGSATLGVTADWRWAAIWYLWAILWGTSFVRILWEKKLGKFVPCLQVFEGVATAWIPGLLMLIGAW